jgi:hypothetical protein
MLFKIITDPAPANPVVKDTDFKLFFPAINRNMDWNSIEPFVQQAEDREIIPAIGDEFYQMLETEYQSSGSISNSDKAKTFRLLRTSLAYYSIYHALPQLALRVGDSGTNETSANDIIPTRQWVFNLSRWETLKTAAEYLDMALKHMEDQVQDGNNVYDSFKNSETYTESRELLIPNARVFQRYYNINNSRITYTKLRPYIRKAEQRFLLPLLDNFYTELSTQHKDGSITGNNKALLPTVQQLLAEYTVVLAIPDLNFVNDGAGWRIVENPNASPMPQQQAITAVQQLHTKAEQNAAHFEIELKNKLYGDLDAYPTFRDSDANELKHDDNDDGVADSEQDLYNLPPEPGAVII